VSIQQCCCCCCEHIRGHILETFQENLSVFPDIVKDCPKIRNLPKTFLRSFENVAPDFCPFTLWRVCVVLCMKWNHSTQTWHRPVMTVLFPRPAASRLCRSGKWWCLLEGRHLVLHHCVDGRRRWWRKSAPTRSTFCSRSSRSLRRRVRPLLTSYYVVIHSTCSPSTSLVTELWNSRVDGLLCAAGVMPLVLQVNKSVATVLNGDNLCPTFWIPGEWGHCTVFIIDV